MGLSKSMEEYEGYNSKPSSSFPTAMHHVSMSRGEDESYNSKPSCSFPTVMRHVAGEGYTFQMDTYIRNNWLVLKSFNATMRMEL